MFVTETFTKRKTMRAISRSALSPETTNLKSSHRKLGYENASVFCLVRFVLKWDNREPSGILTRTKVNTRNMWGTSVFNATN